MRGSELGERKVVTAQRGGNPFHGDTKGREREALNLHKRKPSLTTGPGSNSTQKGSRVFVCLVGCFVFQTGLITQTQVLEVCDFLRGRAVASGEEGNGLGVHGMVQGSPECTGREQPSSWSTFGTGYSTSPRTKDPGKHQQKAFHQQGTEVHAEGI